MESSSYESHILMAIEALKKDPQLSIQAAANIYKVPRTTLRRRYAGNHSRRDISANNRKLTDLEENVLLDRILDLDSRGFQARLEDVREMANRLRTDRDASPVGPRWPERFITRHPELTTRFRRRIDYQRAQCEDPEVVNAWFRLVCNIKAKYGILDDDTYNFDETGFQMGMLSSAKVVTSSERHGRPRTKQPGNREFVTVIQGVCATGWVLPSYVVVKGRYHLTPWYENGRFPKDWRIHTSTNGWTTNEIGLDWIKHFNLHTKARTQGVYRLLVLDGHESHHSDDFDTYCKENNIIPICMPPHSSHFLQPLDVGCFSPLKLSYGKEIEKMMRMQITHITKDDFFDAFLAAFTTAFTENNIRAGFRATGLVPLDPEVVLSRLDPKLSTPSPPTSRPGTAESWVTKTPTTSYDITQQSTAIKKRIARHQSSSPTHMYEIIDAQARGMSKMAHELVLLRGEVRDLRTANEILSKRRRAKKTRLWAGGSLSIQEVEDLIAQKDIDEQLKKETPRTSSRIMGGEQRVRRCGVCGNTGHNVRTCQVAIDASKEEDSE
jgi:hypothetical protein